MTITKAKAILLKDALLEHRSLSDVHNLTSFDLVQRIIHDSYLASALIPLTNSPKKDHSSAKWTMHLAVIDPGDSDWLAFNGPQEPGEPAYALIELQPMTAYVGSLESCDLTKPWWAAAPAFGELARLLAPGYRQRCSLTGGRASWGAQQRAAFSEAFDERWADDSLELEPTVIVDPRKVRFGSMPRLEPFSFSSSPTRTGTSR
jgi:hypothetical protein